MPWVGPWVVTLEDPASPTHIAHTREDLPVPAHRSRKPTSAKGMVGCVVACGRDPLAPSSMRLCLFILPRTIGSQDKVEAGPRSDGHSILPVNLEEDH